MITPTQVIQVARSWVGVPFAHQGRSRNGVDCLGLAIMVARELELVPRQADRYGYSRLPHDGQLEAGIAKYCRLAPSLEAGGLVLIRWHAEPQHVAIYTGESLIHSYSNIGRVTEHGFRGHWPKRVASAWRLPGVSYGS
jgi:cell wall-associated NlpC family hydrolase